jgi:hypothetical protein
MSSTTPSISFATNIGVPFARLRIGHVSNYSAFSNSLAAWLKEPTQQPSWFTDFNRLINPILVNTNPTASQVADAKNRAAALNNSMNQLLSILDSYSVDQVPAADTLVKTFRDKGADRAADLLTQGQFTAFFGVDVDTSSYAGTFLSNVRDVARNDMPVRKTGRQDAMGGRLISSAPSPDFEYDQSDIDKAPVPDPPADFDK